MPRGLGRKKMETYSAEEYRPKGRQGVLVTVQGPMLKVRWGDGCRKFNVEGFRSLIHRMSQAADIAEKNGGSMEILMEDEQ